MTAMTFHVDNDFRLKHAQYTFSEPAKSMVR